jgi:WXG100 family type VII secretion target
MGERLKVDPIDLHMSSDHMEMHHSEMQAAHTSANGAIETAQTGWVGTSGTALQSKLTEWQAATTKLCGDIEAHGTAYRTAARLYAQNDTNSAEAIDRTL